MAKLLPAIYILKDPRTGDVRYVGQTKNAFYRRQKHMCVPRKYKYQKELINWQRSLAAMNLRNEFVVLEYCSLADLDAREAFYIQHYRSIGALLFNAASGGHGTTGYRFTDEQREKIAQSKRGKPSPKKGNAKAKVFCAQKRAYD
jgi:hypothetical protein